MSSGFLQPVVYGSAGLSADQLNVIVRSSQFISDNLGQLQSLLTAPGVTRQWHAMRVVGSSSIAANRWEYVLRKVQPASTPTSIVDSGLTELTEVTAYNLAEYGNTAAVAGGGVNATRANTNGFSLLKVPDDAFVHAFVMYQADGKSVALFERMNAWDGECIAELINTIDGGIY